MPPSPADPVIADAICDAISTQPRGLGAILADLGNPINPSTWYKWLRADPDLSQRYARARADQAQVLADEITQIADTVQPGEIVIEVWEGMGEKRKLKAIRREVREMIEHRKLRIEARKWLASKLLPKVYGDKLAHTGADGESPLTIKVDI